MGIPQVWRINYIQAHLSLSLSGWASLPLLLVTCPIMSSVVPVHFILSQTWTSVRSIIWNKQPIRLTAIIMIIIMTYFRSGQQRSWNILMNFISGESENPQLEYSAITAVYSQTERFRGYSETGLVFVVRLEHVQFLQFCVLWQLIRPLHNRWRGHFSCPDRLNICCWVFPNCCP